jgi:uncharacterized protein involved in exopolysaccharide biosynthesis
MRHLVFARLYPLLHALWRYRYLILIPIIIMPILMTTGGLFKAKRYYSETTILVQESAMLNPFLEDLSISINLKQRIKALQVIIHSRNILEKVIHDLNLAPTDDLLQTDNMINVLRKSLSLSLLGNDLVQLSLIWSTPSEMPLILNKVSDIFKEKLRAPGRASVDGSELFLQRQLETTQLDLELAESALAKFKAANANNLPQLQGAKAQNDLQLVNQIRETELNLLQARSKRTNLYQRLASTNPIVGILEQEIVKAEAELAILRASYTDQHSSVKGVIRRLNRLKQERSRLVDEQQALNSQEINQLWQRIANSNQSNDPTKQPILLSQFEKLQHAESQIQALGEELTLLKEQTNELSEKRMEFANLEKQLKILQRNYDVKSNVYNQLFERYEMAKVTGHLGRFEEPEKLKVIVQPIEPKRPLNWSWWINFCLGTVVGFGLGASLAGVVILFDTRLYQTDHIAKLTQSQVLVRVPLF